MLKIINIDNEINIVSEDGSSVAIFDNNKIVCFVHTCSLNKLVINKLFPDYAEQFCNEFNKELTDEWQDVFNKYYLMQQTINKLKGEKMYVEEMKGRFYGKITFISETC